jgi:hypothetical protein
MDATLTHLPSLPTNTQHDVIPKAIATIIHLYPSDIYCIELTRVRLRKRVDFPKEHIADVLL